MFLKGHEIKRLRVRAKLSQKDLAKKLNITNVHLSNIERDKVEALHSRIKIQEFFDELEENYSIPSLS